MARYCPGVHMGRRGEIVHFVIVAEDQHGSLVRTTLYSPTYEELAEALEKEGILTSHFYILMSRLDPAVHTLLIEKEDYLPFLKENGYLEP